MGLAPSSLKARSAGPLIKAARSGTEDLTVREASGDRGLDLAFGIFSLGGSATGVAGVGFSGSEVKASGAEMADMTPPNAE
jgi:hypothetical protein